MALIYLQRLNLTGIYKIGCTVELKRRYIAKRDRDAVIATLPVPEGENMYEFERAIHNRFAHCREGRAEHFRLSPEDLLIFCSLATEVA